MRGLDARARQEIQGAGRLRERAEGDLIYRAGESASSFFVVASGSVSLVATRRGDADESELRVARQSEVFGEEATIGAARSATARVSRAAVVVEIPVPIFRRVAARSEGAEMVDRLERTLRRGATRDLLRTLALSRDLPASEIDLLLDAVRYVPVSRGQVVYREGDKPADLWLVADGMVQIQTETAGRLHVRAYLSRGDFFGDAEIVAAAPRTASAVASGPSLLLALPAASLRTLSDRNPDLLPRLRRVTLDQQRAQQAIIGGAAAHTTQHAFRDLYRMDIARSLLVIDLETCVRCGHCAWACGDLHGVARIVRRGDKMLAEVSRSEPSEAPSAPQSLLLPSSCQHCENPSCMPSCPTGAIGRDPSGEVFIRDVLCTGCGACAKACPWDNIQMAGRPLTAPRPSGGDYAELAVKCDLCRDFDGGPACVQACPTSSIFRINPSEQLVDMRDLLGSARPDKATVVAPSPRAAMGGAAIAAIAIGAVGAVMHARGLWEPSRGVGYAAGIFAALGFVGLLAYAAPKRGVRLWMKRPDRSKRKSSGTEASASVVSRVRPQLQVHLALGIVTLGLSFAHAPFPPDARPTSGGALYAAFLLTSLIGILTAVGYALIPKRLSRLERTAALPEDFPKLRADLHDKLYREVSGRSEVVKKVFERVLLPYAKSPLGGVFLLLSGRRLREEEAALRAQIGRLLAGPEDDAKDGASLLATPRFGGLDALIRLVVELRALPVQKWLQRTLRVGLPLHIVTFSIATILLVLHVVHALGSP